MSWAGERRLWRLALAVLLLLGGTDGAQDGAEQNAGAAAAGHIVVREGSNMLIECNVTGGHNNIKWYNSKGPLLGEDAGRTKMSRF